MSIDISRFQDADGNWLEADQWPKVRAQVTCRTPDCTAAGATETVEIAENVDGVLRVECGRCGKPPEVVEDQALR